MGDKLELPIAYLYECFAPKFMEGKLYWRKRPREHFVSRHGMLVFNGKYAAKEAAATLNPKGARTSYRHVRLMGHQYMVHRLLWAMFYGFWPDEIDHINGDGTDNSISNLRDCSRGENARNKPLQKNNSSGVSGVKWDSHHSVWVAHIGYQGKRIFIGRFDHIYEAACARKSAENRYGYHANHGRKHG